MNLYLSRLLLNSRSRRAMSELLHPYEMHRTLMHAFPDSAGKNSGEAREEFGVLFRAENPKKPGDPARILVQSLVQPDWSFLEHFDGYLDIRSDAPCEYKDIMPVISKIRQGNRFAFRLRANPTKRIGNKEDPMKGKRVELFREEDQIQWILRKAKEREKDLPGGFDLMIEGGKTEKFCSVRVQPEGKMTGRRGGKDGKVTVTHLSVLYEGLLEVTDKEAFVQTVIKGIGSAKAFGFGLLSLAPSSSLKTE
jgi:CRISPR system Cascade subunit CasE